MSRHISHRQPKKRAGFSWGRYVDAERAAAVEWRLFRRDHTGRLHFEHRLFLAGTPRDHIAGVLLIARRRLRESVDEIDLAAMMKEAA